MACDDPRHARIQGDGIRSKPSPKVRFVLTDLILVQLVTLVRTRAGASTAVGVADSLMRSRRYELIFVDAALLSGALKQMSRFSDKRPSLADCASFEAIARLGLSSAFSFDRHFRDCGFQIVP
jgi:predicted nucleic acid-binding protein